MTGRGVDQVLPHPGDPRIQEPQVRSAETYVQLAEQASGRIPRPVDFSYIWGDALQELASRRPGVRIVNFETTITRSDDYWKGKGIHYRMHPDNVPCITAAHIDCCVLANNHALDYGDAGLLETVDTLKTTGVRIAGAGRNLAEARAPAVIEVPSKGRVIVFGFGTETSGILPGWAATDDRPGVNFLTNLSDDTIDRIGDMVRSIKRPRTSSSLPSTGGATGGSRFQTSTSSSPTASSGRE
jgi:poly-gamma-glutamate capsule biosynthesis protein CapA/YwtB (metallophosphatase superfamily)